MNNHTDCRHKRIKKNFPFGRKSKPTYKCKDCDKEISRRELKELKNKKFKRRKNRRW